MARRARRDGPKSTFNPLVWGVVGGMIAVYWLQLAVEWISQHRIWAALIGIVLLSITAAVVKIVVSTRRAAAARQAALERSISHTDDMTGPQFEQWVARLLTRSGFTEVQVRGGAGDLGADIIAVSPVGHRVVIQCKRHRRNISSPEIQKFAGTCRSIHKAEIPVIVTTAGFSQPARDLAAQLGIVLIDRDQLAAWAADDIPPARFTSLSR